jgi:hypothetical protein
VAISKAWAASSPPALRAVSGPAEAVTGDIRGTCGEPEWSVVAPLRGADTLATGGPPVVDGGEEIDGAGLDALLGGTDEGRRERGVLPLLLRFFLLIGPLGASQGSPLGG